MKFLVFAIVLFSQITFAKEATVFEVRKNVKLDDSEPTVHDYYINAGKQDGLKEGMAVTVTRKDPFKDNSLSKIDENLVVNVAELDLVHVQATFSVGRIRKVNDTKNAPVLEFQAIMIGDKVDTASGRMAARRADNSATGTAQKVAGASKPKEDARPADEPKKAVSEDTKAAVVEAPAPAQVKEESKDVVKAPVQIAPTQQPIEIHGETPGASATETAKAPASTQDPQESPQRPPASIQVQ
jgi:hypothetical protein